MQHVPEGVIQPITRPPKTGVSFHLTFVLLKEKSVCAD